MTTATQKANVKKWLKALRSGKYKQGKDMLRTADDGFCCLGVLADTCGLKWSARPNEEVRGKPAYSLKNCGDAQVVSDAWFARATGFDRDYQLQLAEMNDNGYKFEKIANKIEKQFKLQEAF